MNANIKKPWTKPTLRRLPVTDELRLLFADQLESTVATDTTECRPSYAKRHA
jgi:hypothetical protein